MNGPINGPSNALDMLSQLMGAEPFSLGEDGGMPHATMTGYYAQLLAKQMTHGPIDDEEFDHAASVSGMTGRPFQGAQNPVTGSPMRFQDASGVPVRTAARKEF